MIHFKETCAQREARLFKAEMEARKMLFLPEGVKATLRKEIANVR